MSITEKLKDFLKQNQVKSENFEFSSLDLVEFAVKLEEHFEFQFELDEINNENFKNLTTLLPLVEKKIKEKN